jgi:hypothetical protein
VVGTVFVSPDDTASPCNTCASKLTNEVMKSFLDLEPLYIDRVASIDKEDTEDVMAVLKEALNLFSDAHWIPYMLETMIGESLKNSSPSNVARIDILHRRLEFLKSTFPMPTYTTAWLLEEIGDWYFLQSSRALAAAYFERAYWMLRILCGQDHPFTANVQAKWDEVLVEKSRSYA